MLDKSLIAESKEQMYKYLNNSGFYNSSIQDSIVAKGEEKRKKKSNIYNIKLSEPYLVQKIDYKIPDKQVMQTVLAENEYRLIDSGQIFNSFVLDKERSRITKSP
ncbi:MAG: hypothetical protein R2750_03285 [Bacteroidales bacterium]